jgi:hypothetical protein
VAGKQGDPWAQHRGFRLIGLKSIRAVGTVMISIVFRQVLVQPLQLKRSIVGLNLQQL